MAEKASRLGLRFRPHFKTPQSAEIGEWFRDAGVNAITVSSLSMAKYFSDAGWKDILIAVPANLRGLDSAELLAKKVSLHLIVEDETVVEAISAKAPSVAGIWIKVDCGYKRSGVFFKRGEKLRKIVQTCIDAKLPFTGLLTHAGNTYKCSTPEEIEEVHRSSLDRILIAKKYVMDLVPSVEISVGDTPSCSLLESFEEVNEIRPGNFVFYDAQQLSIGSCEWDQVAVCMACPVIAINSERDEMVIYGGSVHFSADHLVEEDGSGRNYGIPVRLSEDGWSTAIEGARMVRLSQEHGVIRFPEGSLAEWKRGDLIGIIPIHSCLTADCMNAYYTPAGQKIERWRYSYPGK